MRTMISASRSSAISLSHGLVDGRELVVHLEHRCRRHCSGRRRASRRLLGRLDLATERGAAYRRRNTQACRSS